MTFQKPNQTRVFSHRTIMPLLSTLMVIIAAAGTLGCSMCCGPYDFDYPTFGGKHERVDRAYGRVGSIFSDPTAGYYGESADSNLDSDDEDRVRRRDSDLDDDDNMQEFRRELESVTPRESETVPGNGAEELPQPDDAENDPTASRRWKHRPLRAEPQWR